MKGNKQILSYINFMVFMSERREIEELSAFSKQFSCPKSHIGFICLNPEEDRKLHLMPKALKPNLIEPTLILNKLSRNNNNSTI